jgi:methylmalonyl-CoA mutase cobalamin-binding domain/chain
MQAIPTTGVAQGIQFLEKTSSKLLKKGTADELPVVVCSLGDASVTEGEVSEAFQFAALHQLPIIFLVQDNEWGISVSAAEARTANAYEFIAGFKGFQRISIDGSEFEESLEAMQKVFNDVRTNRRPWLVHAKVPLLGHHTSGVRKEFYRTDEDLSKHSKEDPFEKLQAYLLQKGFEEGMLKDIAAQSQAAVQLDFEKAVAAAEPDAGSVSDFVFVPTPITEEKGLRAAPGKDKIMMVDAALFAIREIMETYPEAVLYGQDVGRRLGGVFREAATLAEQFGDHRVFNTAIQEDANAIAMTSYQGGHIEYFKYMYDLLQERGAGHIKIFGGGGGVILPVEIKELMDYGIARIYSPDDGRSMGLQGMINDLVKQSDFPTGHKISLDTDNIAQANHLQIARVITGAENYAELHASILNKIRDLSQDKHVPVLGITGTGGAGKSSLIDELVRRFLLDFPQKRMAIISIDPSKRKTGGALLGDRIRMNSINNDRIYMRSMATRQANLAMSSHVDDAVSILKLAGYDLIIVETSGIGQSDTQITEHCDVSMYVMTPEYGAATQLEKIDMLDYANIVALNKFDKRGALDALRDVRKQFQRNHKLFETDVDKMPVFGTIASQFNDPGMNSLYRCLMDVVAEKTGADLKSNWSSDDEMSEKIFIIPPARNRYLSEISESNRLYAENGIKQQKIAQRMFSVNETIEEIQNRPDQSNLIDALNGVYDSLNEQLFPENKKLIESWDSEAQRYKDEFYIFKVRDKEIKIKTHSCRY